MMPRIVVILLSLTVLCCAGCLYPAPVDTVDPIPPVVVNECVRTEVPTPSDEFKEATKAVRGFIVDPADAITAAQFYVDFADVVDRDTDIIKTTGAIRKGFIHAETLMLQRTELVGKYPGFGAAKDTILEAQLGLEDVQLSPEKRKKAVDTFRAIAWSIQDGALN
jgi:hypothetical protein